MVPLKWSESILMSMSFRGCPYSAENYYIGTTLNRDKENQENTSISTILNHIDFRFRTAIGDGTIFHGIKKSGKNGSKELIIAGLHDSRYGKLLLI